MPAQPHERPTIILDCLKYDWLPSEMEGAVRLWEAGIPFPDMVDSLRPKSTNAHTWTSYSDRADEVALLLMHLGREGRIERRAGGVLR